MKTKFDKILGQLRESDISSIDIIQGTVNSVPIYTNNSLIGSPVSIDPITGDITIPGKILNPTGNIIEIEATNLTIEDPLIKLAKDNIGNTFDIGFYGKYNNTYTGFYREALTGSYKLFEGSTVEPTTTVDKLAVGYALASLDVLKINNVALTSLGSANQFLNGQGNYTLLNTSFIGENTNLYYTEARVDANTNVSNNSAHRVDVNNPHNTKISNLDTSNLNDLNTLLGSTLLNQTIIATNLINGFMSNTDKIKLDTVEVGANSNVQSDWTSINGDSFILNKPTTISIQQISDIASNVIHKTSDGTDHTFIDQDIKTTASPSFQGLTVSNTSGNVKTINGVYTAKEEFYIEKIGTVNNTTTTDVEYFSSGTAVNSTITAQGGLYDVTINMVTRNTSASGSVRVAPQINSVAIFTQSYRHRPGQGADRQYISIIKRVNLIAGNSTFQLQLDNVGQGTARIYEANILIKQV